MHALPSLELSPSESFCCDCGVKQYDVTTPSTFDSGRGVALLLVLSQSGDLASSDGLEAAFACF